MSMIHHPAHRPTASAVPSGGFPKAQSIVSELTRLANEATERVDQGAALEALSSLVALAKVNSILMACLEDMLTEAPGTVAASDDFVTGVYL